MFQFIRNWLDRRIIRRSTITSSEWEQVFAMLPLLHGLTADEKRSLRELAILFLNDKSFTGANDLIITQQMALIIALQACLPLLNLGIRRYKGWYTVIVYPAGFAPERVIRDEYGVEHHVQSSLTGEAWLRGPVILSWDDTEHAGIIDGENLVIHEFAHKLDMINGHADGFPPLHQDMDSAAWAEAFSTGFKDFKDKCSRGEDIEINCYGASSPAEYFAVLSEVFFERPDVLQRHYAAVYDQLRMYYRQDVLKRLR
jgi:hypothetical protein